MTDSTTDTLFDNVTETSKTHNETMKFFQKSFENISDMDIRKNYKENGENMFEPFTPFYISNACIKLIKNYIIIISIQYYDNNKFSRRIRFGEK